VPIISVGNITIGGTGKTPHVEYLISLLKDKFEVVALSRGYKRKSKGFIEVQVDSEVTAVGDEPLQIKKKFPEAIVAVCENRVIGVERILGSSQDLKIPDVIVLDDAFQHRRISPGINILLIDYNRPLKKDSLLPAGRLRESSSQIKRANVIIFTKCSGEITPIMRRIMQKEVHLKPYQELYFTTIHYNRIIPVFSGNQLHDELLSEKKFAVLVVTGIASPLLIYKYVEKIASHMETVTFPDHHHYSKEDICTISRKFEKINSEKKIILTTEKDTMHFKSISNLPDEFKESLYYITVQVKFLGNEGNMFNKKILNYVGENKSNRELHKRKNKLQS
jgi:tetraacyldisaccharide 4'-kinase